MNILLELFWSFFQIGLFSIGGGYAALPLIQNQVIDIQGWLTFPEFTDLITIAEMTPGPIALNASTFVGTRIAGFPGALVATIGCITPSCVIVLTLAWLYAQYSRLGVIQGILGGLRPAVLSLIGAAGIRIIIMAFWGENSFARGFGSINWIAAGLFTAALFALKKFKLSPIYVILGCGAVGGVIYTLI